MKSKLKCFGLVYLIYVIFVGIINGLFIYFTYDAQCTPIYTSGFQGFMGGKDRYFQYSILGFVMIIFYILWILLFRCCSGFCCDCFSCCCDQLSKRATKCKICCEGCCGNPFILGFSYIGLGYFIYANFPNCANTVELLNSIINQQNNIKILFITVLILISIALIIFIPLYFFYVKKSIFKQRRKSIAKRDGKPYIKKNNIELENKNNYNNMDDDDIIVKPIPPQQQQQPFPQPNQQNINNNNRRQSLPVQSYTNNSGLSALNIEQNRTRAMSYNPKNNIENDPPPVAFGGFGVILDDNNNNDNNNNNILKRTPTHERLKSHENEIENDDNVDESVEMEIDNDNNNQKNDDPEIDIELSVSLVDDGSKKKTTKGDEPSISFPDGFLGFARRVSDGVLKVLNLLDQDTECVICMDELEIKQEMAQLNCGHCFHKECVVDWLENDHTCPFCRQDVKNYSKMSPSQIDLLSKK